MHELVDDVGVGPGVPDHQRVQLVVHEHAEVPPVLAVRRVALLDAQQVLHERRDVEVLGWQRVLRRRLARAERGRQESRYQGELKPPPAPHQQEQKKQPSTEQQHHTQAQARARSGAGRRARAAGHFEPRLGRHRRNGRRNDDLAAVATLVVVDGVPVVAFLDPLHLPVAALRRLGELALVVARVRVDVVLVVTLLARIQVPVPAEGRDALGRRRIGGRAQQPEVGRKQGGVEHPVAGVADGGADLQVEPLLLRVLHATTAIAPSLRRAQVDLLRNSRRRAVVLPGVVPADHGVAVEERAVDRDRVALETQRRVARLTGGILDEEAGHVVDIGTDELWPLLATDHEAVLQRVALGRHRDVEVQTNGVEGRRRSGGKQAVAQGVGRASDVLSGPVGHAGPFIRFAFERPVAPGRARRRDRVGDVARGEDEALAQPLRAGVEDPHLARVARQCNAGRTTGSPVPSAPADLLVLAGRLSGELDAAAGRMVDHPRRNAVDRGVPRAKRRPSRLARGLIREAHTAGRSPLTTNTASPRVGAL